MARKPIGNQRVFFTFHNFSIGFLAITSVLIKISLQFSYHLKKQFISFAVASSLFFWLAGSASRI